jgi:transposase
MTSQARRLQRTEQQVTHHAPLTAEPLNLTTAQKEERRLAAVALLLKGWSQAAIARHMNVSRKTVSRWEQELHKEGIESLHAKPKTGRKPRLTKSQWNSLLVVLEIGTREYGYTGAVWTLDDIQDVIWREFKVVYNRSYLIQKLRESGWSTRYQPRISRSNGRRGNAYNG